MLGRFLEISIATPDILASIGFYEALGLQQIAANEIWPHPYAVMTDGRLFIGLHQQSMSSPMLTFVQADLAQHVAALRQTLQPFHIEFDHEHLSSESFNELRFRDLAGQSIRLLEARTFSPPDLTPNFSTECGYFVEYGMPNKDLTNGKQFWEQLGFIAMDEEATPFNRMPLTSSHLNLGLHRSRALREPVLVFEDPEMPARLATLRTRGLNLSDAMPDTLDEQCNAVLIAPEGTRLLLMQSEET